MKKVLEFCEKYNMIPPGAKVLAAVSGGADSMCLLDVLCSLAPSCGFSVAAAHYNHTLRGAESDGDEEFVEGWCKERGIEFYSGRGDVTGASKDSGRGIEETARLMRYGFLYETAEKCGASRIATAHNANDNAETVLLDLTRGAGLKGLCGIPPVRGVVIRPLLTVTREEIIAYLSERSVPHREDSTNALDDCARNTLRHHVIPVLQELNPGFLSAVSDASELLRTDEEYLSSLARSFIDSSGSENTLPAGALAALPAPVASRAVRLMCQSSLSSRHVGSILALAEGASPSARVDVPGMTVARQYDALIFGAEERDSFPPVTLVPGMTADIPAAGVRVSCELSLCPDRINKSFTTFLFTRGNICDKLIVRPRMTGDSIRLAGGGRTKTLKKLFIEKKIPASLRQSVPVIADGGGPLAVFGIGRGSRALPSPGDEVYKVTFEEIN